MTSCGTGSTHKNQRVLGATALICSGKKSRLRIAGPTHNNVDKNALLDIIVGKWRVALDISNPEDVVEPVSIQERFIGSDNRGFLATLRTAYNSGCTCIPAISALWTCVID